MFTFFHDKTVKESVFTFAFYNLDNLFDVFDDPDTLDDDYTPEGKRKWTYRRYKKKVERLTGIISELGRDYSPVPPILVGLAELENEEVVKDLVNSKALRDYHYDYAHYDSPDERGVDVALLYQKKYFELIDSRPYTVFIFDDNGKRDYTRDILCVKGKLFGEVWYVIVNHWPSRQHGTEDTEHKRLKAAEIVKGILSDIREETPESNIVVMGDFNDEPYDKSLQYIMDDSLFNPMQVLKDRGLGSTNHRGDWYMFDQFVFSKNLLDSSRNKIRFRYAEIYKTEENSIWKGKKKDHPFRTYIGKKYTGGQSDHFPIIAYLEKKN
jgi:hypothetical protein